MTRLPYIAGLMAFAAFANLSVMAHRIKVFADVEGGAIRGSVYFAGGGPARQVTVRIEDDNGRLLGAVETDDDGTFAYTPTAHCDHVIIAKTADGHRAAFTVPAAELPDGADAAAESADAAEPPAAGRTTTAPPQSDMPVSYAMLSRQVSALRRQLDAREDRRRLQDVLGGIGYIFGILGVIMYMKARRRADG